MPGFRSTVARLGVALLVSTAGCGPGGAGATTTPVAGMPSVSSEPATTEPTSLIPSADPGSSGAPGPSNDAADIVRIALSGQAPDAIQIVGDRAWMLAGESGTLMEVDLAAARELRSIEVGFGATHLGLTAPATVAVARFDASGWSYLPIVDTTSEAVNGVSTGALGALAAGEPGLVWALEKADRLLLVDVTGRKIIDSVSVEVDPNTHMEVQWGAGSAWVSSDATAVRRVRGSDRTIEATIETGGGVPFAFHDGLVWGARPDEIWAIDPATNQVARRIPLAGVIEVLALDVDGDEAWLAVRHPGHVGAVLRLDLASARCSSMLRYRFRRRSSWPATGRGSRAT